MVWRKAFAVVWRFYFNYHYVDTNLPYVHSLFSRRAQYAVRAVIAFLASAFLAYGSGLKHQVSQLFLIPLITMLTVQETFALTMAASFQMLVAITPAMIFLYIVQKIGLGYHDYVAAEITLLITIFFISFVCTQIQTRKMPLVLTAIFFASIVNQPVVPSTFVFILLEEFVIAVCMAVLTSLLILPSFTTMEIENRVSYGVVKLGEMHEIIIQTFLCKDQLDAQVLLSRVTTIEQMVLQAIGPLQAKLAVVRFEPSRLLQWLFNRRRRHVIDLTLQEQENFVTSLFLHVRSMRSMIKQCQFNEYHSDIVKDLRESLLSVSSCQMIVLNNIVKSSPLTKVQFIRSITDLDQANRKLRKAYKTGGLRRMQLAFTSGITVRSQDHLSHAFFLFQLGAISQLSSEVTTKKKAVAKKKEKKSFKDRFIPKWSRVFSALKTTIIIGVGSVFVMVPVLVKTFENGQWILIALCMTQGDTVGGAFTTMRMRLFGTLLGAMWAYITYLAARENIYQTFGMFVPWFLFFGYIRSLPSWTYTAVVATFTPILINLGRLSYTTALPAGNYLLLRIEENVVGIGLAIVLTLLIFPVFALDLLKKNTQDILAAFRKSIDSILSIYNSLFLDGDSSRTLLDVDAEVTEVESFFAVQRNGFYQLITNQRALLANAAMEPTFLWINHFPTKDYSTLIEQEIDICQILHTIDATLLSIHQYSLITTTRRPVIGKEFFAQLRKELTIFTRQFSDCLGLWASYFKYSQSRHHQLFSECSVRHDELSALGLGKYDPYLTELHRTVHRLENKHQEVVDQILKHYIDVLQQGNPASTTLLLFSNENPADLTLIAVSTLYFSITNLVRAATALGTTIHNIYELETTHRYIPY